MIIKQPELPDNSNTPCKSIVVDNINAVKNGKELTAPLRYLNKSCDFKQAYRRIVGEFEKKDAEENKAVQKAYRDSDKYKEYLKSEKYKALQKLYYQRKKQKAKRNE